MTSTEHSFCGDGIIDPGEQCDDGPDQEDVDPCSPFCTLPACGDGFLQESIGEECDNGTDNDDSESCKKDCTYAKCGDGFVQASNDEECDAGLENGEYNSECTENCKVDATNFCGDGIVQEQYEECDPGQGPAAPCVGCSLGGRFIFVTSQEYDGDLGGLAGGDAKCQAAADAAGLPGDYQAWLSTGPCWSADILLPPVSAKIRLSPGGGGEDEPYVMPPGSSPTHVVAPDWNMFLSIEHLRPILRNEFGIALPDNQANGVWTGTSNEGSSLVMNNGEGDCKCWSNDSIANAIIGEAGFSDFWSHASDDGCNAKHRLYCLQSAAD